MYVLIYMWVFIYLYFNATRVFLYIWIFNFTQCRLTLVWLCVWLLFCWNEWALSQDWQVQRANERHAVVISLVKCRCIFQGQSPADRGKNEKCHLHTCADARLDYQEQTEGHPRWGLNWKRQLGRIVPMLPNLRRWPWFSDMHIQTYGMLNQLICRLRCTTIVSPPRFSLCCLWIDCNL